MLTIHHLGHSQSERVVWLCEELGIPYTLRHYTRDAVTILSPPDLKALHPLGAAPLIEDGDLLLAESAAIVEYIIVKHGGGPMDQPTRNRFSGSASDTSQPLVLLASGVWRLASGRVQVPPASFPGKGELPIHGGSPQDLERHALLNVGRIAIPGSEPVRAHRSGRCSPSRVIRRRNSISSASNALRAAT
jgi:hypothetical protein